MNTDAPPSLSEARQRVLEIQTKLHRWATDDGDRRFDDLYNLVCDPAFLAVAWSRVKGNKGARTAGVDGVAPVDLAPDEQRFLTGLRAQLKAGGFSPLPVRERRIPKRGGKLRSLRIPTAAERCVQAALKLVLEPISEADFKPCSHGFRPERRAHDAIAEARHFAAHGYRWVLEGDIEACFDSIDHPALMDRVRDRIGDKRVLGLVKAFLKAGILGEEGPRSTEAGTPQGGILSPLLANIALSILDEWFTAFWAEKANTGPIRAKRRHQGWPNYRLVRYADDFVVMVHGEYEDAASLRDQIADLLAPMGLDLSEAKTAITHIDEGFDFLGYRIQRHQKRGTNKRFVYTYPSKTALQAIKRKVKTLSRTGRNRTLSDLLRRINLVLRGWTNYFRHGASKATFGYLRAYTWQRVVLWLRCKHPHRQLEAASTPPPTRMVAHRRRHRIVRPRPSARVVLPLPGSNHSHAVAHRRNRNNRIAPGTGSWRAGCVGTRTSGSAGGPRKRTGRKASTAPRLDPTTPTPHCSSSPAFRLTWSRCDPATGVSLSPEMTTWTAGEVAAFLEATRQDRLYVVWHVALMTGMRRGEVLGLRWRDCDLEAGRIRLVRQLRVVRHVPEFSDLKTDRSRRQVGLDQETVTLLRQHRRAQLEERLMVDDGYQDGDLLFAQPDGVPYHPEAVSKRPRG